MPSRRLKTMHEAGTGSEDRALGGGRHCAITWHVTTVPLPSGRP